MILALVLLPAWALGPFVRAEHNPILAPKGTRFRDPILGKDVAWEAGDTFNPASVVKDGKLVVLYRAEDRSGVGIGSRTSRLGLAESRDGIHFVRRKTPVLFPQDDDQRDAEWPGGCEDPRLVETEDGTYAVFYTQWNRKRARLAVATSRDLVHWKKYGSIFRNAVYEPEFYKAAAPLTKVENGRQTLAKIGGAYWMYWGEEAVGAATSTDLVNWTPVMDGDRPKSLAAPRKGRFDSALTECGPPSVLTARGIVLIYNGKSAESGAYAAGQMLFDRDDPTRLVERLDEPFFRPERPWERKGQYAAGTVFCEGLSWFRGRWSLLYGCADSRVAVATSQ